MHSTSCTTLLIDKSSKLVLCICTEHVQKRSFLLVHAACLWTNRRFVDKLCHRVAELSMCERDHLLFTPHLYEKCLAVILCHAITSGSTYTCEGPIHQLPGEVLLHVT